MSYDIVKPFYPAPPPEGYWKYLASIGISEGELANSCVKEAKVLGIDSTQSITILCDDSTYTNVPVWMHTDAGARTSVYRDVSTGTSTDLAADQYFKNSAFMFPIPGCVADNGYGIAVDHNVTEGGGITFDTDQFTVETVQGRTFDATIIDHMDGIRATIKAAYTDVDAGVVTIDGTVLDPHEYINTNDTTIEIFIAEIIRSGSAIPVECIVSFSGDVVSLCSSVVLMEMVPEAYTVIDEVTLATNPTTAPIVHVIILTAADGTTSALGVIGIVDNVTPAEFAAGQPYPTYRMYVKVEIKQNQIGTGGYMLSNVYLYDMINDQVASIPSLDASNDVALPFFDVDGFTNMASPDPPGFNEYTLAAEYTTEEFAVFTEKTNALAAFLAKGITVEVDDPIVAQYGDWNLRSAPYYGYDVGDTRNDIVCVNESGQHWPGGIKIETSPGSGKHNCYYDCYEGTVIYDSNSYPVYTYPVIYDSAASLTYVQWMGPDRYSSYADGADTGYAVTFRATYDNGQVTSLIGSEANRTEIYDNGTGSGGVADYHTENIGSLTIAFKAFVDGVLTISDDVELGGSWDVTAAYQVGWNWAYNYTYNRYFTDSDRVAANAKNLICDMSMFGLVLMTQPYEFVQLKVPFNDPVLVSTTYGEFSVDFLGAVQYGDNAYRTTSGFEAALTGWAEDVFNHLYDTYAYAYGAGKIAIDLSIHFVPYDILEELLHDDE